MTKFTNPKEAKEDSKGLKMETKFLPEGRWDVSDVEEEAFREFRAKHGLVE